MGFAVPLNLRCLVKEFPRRTSLSIFEVDRLTGEGLDDGEHATVRKIAVVGDCEHVAPVFAIAERVNKTPSQVMDKLNSIRGTGRYKRCH